MAEIVGVSERTLQRRLAQSGLTYSQIVQDARFSITSDLLVDLDLDIVVSRLRRLPERRIFPGRSNGSPA